MKYPQTLTFKLLEIKSIVSTWPIAVGYDEVIKWMMQFDNGDFDIPFRIIKNLNVIGYDELKNGLNVAYSKLERKSIDKNTRIDRKNTLFAGIGEGGKSGAMISYNFRVANELSEENFLDEDSFEHIEKGRIENIVLVDDIISTGHQAIREIQKLRDNLIPLGVKNIFLLTAVGMKEGIKKIEDETGVYVFSAFEYDVNDTINSFDSAFYDGLDFGGRKSLKERLEYYGKICNPKSPFGYGGIGGLIVFYYNTPNSTIPHIWSTLNSWLPLFKRTLRINGIDSYYKQFENLQSQKPKTKKGKGEFTLFVDSKVEEAFFDSLSNILKEATDSDKINIIALGGGIYSEKLIENLNKTETKYLFLIEDDPYSPSVFKRKIEDVFKGKPHIKMSPVIDYINWDSLLADREFIQHIYPRSIEEQEINSREFRKDFESRVFRRPSVDKEIVLKHIVQKHIDPVKLQKLISEISEITMVPKK